MQSANPTCSSDLRQSTFATNAASCVAAGIVAIVATVITTGGSVRSVSPRVISPSSFISLNPAGLIEKIEKEGPPAPAPFVDHFLDSEILNRGIRGALIQEGNKRRNISALCLHYFKKVILELIKQIQLFVPTTFSLISLNIELQKFNLRPMGPRLDFSRIWLKRSDLEYQGPICTLDWVASCFLDYLIFEFIYFTYPYDQSLELKDLLKKIASDLKLVPSGRVDEFVPVGLCEADDFVEHWADWADHFDFEHCSSIYNLIVPFLTGYGTYPSLVKDTKRLPDISPKLEQLKSDVLQLILFHQRPKDLRYYSIAWQTHQSTGQPHLDILLVYDKMARKSPSSYNYLLPLCPQRQFLTGPKVFITGYAKFRLNKAILPYGSGPQLFKEDPHPLSTLPEGFSVSGFGRSLIGRNSISTTVGYYQFSTTKRRLEKSMLVKLLDNPQTIFSKFKLFLVLNMGSVSIFDQFIKAYQSYYNTILYTKYKGLEPILNAGSTEIEYSAYFSDSAMRYILGSTGERLRTVLNPLVSPLLAIKSLIKWLIFYRANKIFEFRHMEVIEGHVAQVQVEQIRNIQSQVHKLQEQCCTDEKFQMEQGMGTILEDIKTALRRLRLEIRNDFVNSVNSVRSSMEISPSSSSSASRIDFLEQRIQ